MFQERESCRALGLGAADEKGRSRRLELPVHEVLRPGGLATTGRLVICTGFFV
jgi:hypothetical protein